MVEDPQKWVVPFIEVGADLITVHIERSPHIYRLVNLIKEKGLKVGVALNPATSLKELEYILPDLDAVLIMTVNPGFGAQKFLLSVLPKIRELREMVEKRRLSLEIEVDGGINQDTASKAIQAGASLLITGTAIFEASDPAKAIVRLRNS